MDSSKRAIYETLLYSTLFSFPLTREELYRYLISPKSLTNAVFTRTLQRMQSLLLEKEGYLTLYPHESFITRRVQQSAMVTRKRQTAERLARFLARIPTIYFVGLSGSLAAGSASDDSDIDFFIITKENSLFITRFISLILMQLIGKRRRVGEKNAGNKVCLNMWMDTSVLSFPKSRQDLYTAREIAQCKPLVDKHTTYHSFIQANPWVSTFLPHAFSPMLEPKYIVSNHFLGEQILPLFESPIRFLQGLLIKRHRTTETVTPHMVAFHPMDYRKRILKRYDQLLST